MTYVALRRLIDRDEFSEGGWVTIDSFHRDLTSASIELGVSPSSEQDIQLWLVDVAGLRSYKLIYEVADNLLLTSRHVTVDVLAANRVELHIINKPASVSRAIDELVLAHRATVGEWLPFMSCFIEPLEERLADGDGIVARGPRSFLKSYCAALIGLGVGCRMINETVAQRLVPFGRESELQTLQALVVGRSYVVAESFTFRRGA